MIWRRLRRKYVNNLEQRGPVASNYLDTYKTKVRQSYEKGTFCKYRKFPFGREERKCIAN